MKKRIIACILAVLTAGTAASCGSPAASLPDVSGPESREDMADGISDETSDDLSADSADTGPEAPYGDERDISVSDSFPLDTSLSEEAVQSRTEYVIYCPDEMLPEIFAACYPGYEVLPEEEPDENAGHVSEGRIGEMKIRWIIADYLTDDEEARHLDELLVRQQTDGASEYDWVDLFVVDSMNLEKYIADGVNVTVDFDTLGITDRQMQQQLPYTRALAGDRRKQYGAAIDISPGVFLYRRSIADEVLGTDDPDEVGAAVADPESFRETAFKAGEAGYKILAGYDAAFAVYSQAAKDGWYSEDGNIRVNDRLMEWVDTMEVFAQKGILGDAEIGTEEWRDGLTGKGSVFGYFLSAEEISLLRETVSKEDAESFGDWGIVTGPGEWYRGGVWLCAAVGTPNPDLSSEIIRTLTCDEDVMKSIHDMTGMAVNNKKVLSEDVFCDALFGDQQTGSVFLAAAERIKNPIRDGQRWMLDDMFQKAYYPYFRGECSANEALAAFYQKAKSLITEDEEW